MKDESRIQQDFIKAVDLFFNRYYPSMCVTIENSKKVKRRVAPLFAVPNEGKRGRQTAMRMKAQGLRSGVPDVFLTVRTTRYSGFYIEFKKPETARSRKGSCEPNQKSWLEFLRKTGYRTKICYSSVEAMEAVEAYMLGCEFCS